MDPRSFVEALSRATIGATFNFYREGDAAPLRRQRLTAYLESRQAAPILLVGEAAGYRGARVSGLPFTSERQLSGTGPAEATATIVHRVLGELGLAPAVLLWNVVPTHPHLPGRHQSNRRPTTVELAGGKAFVRILAAGRHVVPIGRLAHGELGGTYVRHPAHGGAEGFSAGLVAALGQNVTR